MDRVNIPGEAPGSATYYMGFAPEEYGTRLYEMEYYGDAVIRKALMDIGSQRTEPYKVISSSEEYEDLVWKSKGRTIYSCLFEGDSHLRSTRQSIKSKGHSLQSSFGS